MIDAAGAIYVIGGQGTDTTTFYADVWSSTDGGGRPDSVLGVVGGVHWVGNQGGTRGGTTGGTKGGNKG